MGPRDSTVQVGCSGIQSTTWRCATLLRSTSLHHWSTWSRVLFVVGCNHLIVQLVKLSAVEPCRLPSPIFGTDCPMMSFHLIRCRLSASSQIVSVPAVLSRHCSVIVLFQFYCCDTFSAPSGGLATQATLKNYRLLTYLWKWLTEIRCWRDVQHVVWKVKLDSCLLLVLAVVRKELRAVYHGWCSAVSQGRQVRMLRSSRISAQCCARTHDTLLLWDRLLTSFQQNLCKASCAVCVDRLQFWQKWDFGSQ